MNGLFDFDAAIFDLDGTLLDSLYVWGQIDREFFEKRWHTIPPDYIKRISGLSFADTAKVTKEYLHLPESIEEICAEWMAMAKDEYAHHVQLKPGAREYLALLSQCEIKMAIATSNARVLFEPCLARLGILDLFSASLTTDEIGERDKSSGTIFRMAADRLGVSHDRCCVFEDMPEGIAGAKRAGMRAVCIMDEASSHAHDRMAEMADRMARHFSELTDEIRCVIFTARCEGDVRAAYVSGVRDFIMGADVGWKLAAQAGVECDLAIGDFDSAPEPPHGRVERHPVIKDDTDVMLCIRRALSMGLRDILIIGGLGGRLDHTIANVQSLAFIADHGARGALSDGNVHMFIVKNGEICVPRAAGKLSVFALSDVCEGVSIRGAKYEVENVCITNAFPIGAGNDFTEDFARISVRRGTLLVIADQHAET